MDQQWQRFQEKIVAGKKKRPGFTWWRVAASIILVCGLSWLALDRFAGKPAAQMTRDEKIAVLQRLDARGATQMRKSVETIAVRLGISRVTAYAYLDEARRAAN